MQLRKRKGNEVNPLGVTMGIRNFKPCEYWRAQLGFIDRLEIRNYMADEAHQIARSYFLANSQYSHFLFLSEDTITTPSHVKQIIEDSEKGNYPVVCGLSNVDFYKEACNISFRNMRNIVIGGREVYQHPKISDLVQGKYGFPIVKVWFMGTTLAMMRRDVVERLSFGAYRLMHAPSSQRMFGGNRSFGIMQDFQMCKELDALGIPIFCDLRVFCIHFTIPLTEINVRGKPRTVMLYAKDGSTKKIGEDLPYAQ